jgi:DNA primase
MKREGNEMDRVPSDVIYGLTLHDILESVDVHLRQVLRPEQMSCPFHGADTSMSARYYPETNSMYCFACKKSWDPIGFWMQYAEVRFMEAARHLASKYGVDLSKVADIQQLQLKRFYLEKGKNQIDKRKMALYVLEQKLRMVLPLEDIAGKHGARCRRNVDLLRNSSKW